MVMQYFSMKFALLIFLSAAMVVAFAEQPVEECAELEDDLARLACYDDWFSSRQVAEKVLADDDALPATKPDVLPSSVSDRHMDSANSSQLKNNHPSEEDSFGFESELLGRGLDSVVSIAQGQFDYWENGLRVRLANEQLWQVIDHRPLLHNAHDPEVTIHKGIMGSFYLQIEGISTRLKVKRIR